MSQSTDLVIVENLVPAVVFGPGGVNQILDRIKKHAADFKGDISTKRGREDIASFARKIASSKVALDNMGKDLTEAWKKQAAQVDAERRTIRSELDALRDQVRAPLTEWEEADKRRIAEHEMEIARIEQLSIFMEPEPTPGAIHDRLARAERGSNRDWQEFKNRAAQASLAAVTTLTGLLAVANQREADRTELARLTAEEQERQRQEAARQQAEREAKIAAEAAEAAKREAERVAAEQAAEAARAAAAERERIEAKARAEAEAAETERLRIIHDAEEADKRWAAELKAREDKAEGDRIAAERREREAKERAETAERKAAADAKLAEEGAEAERQAAAHRERQAEIKAERERIAAVEAERKRIADARAAEAAEAKRREENKAHRTRINRDAAAGIVLAMSEVHKGTAAEAEEYARAIVTALAKGQVPHCKIEY